MKRIFCAAVLLLGSSGAAMAGHGKAGLWNIATTLNLAMAVPPEMAAQMKKSGLKLPASQTITSQICMTEAEVQSDRPPQMGNNNPGCDSHVIRQSAGGMAADTICHGQIKGTGHIEVAYTDAEHYTGRYIFHGSVGNHPSNLSTTFKGAWVKGDCGSVKPYVAKK